MLTLYLTIRTDERVEVKLCALLNSAPDKDQQLPAYPRISPPPYLGNKLLDGPLSHSLKVSAGKEVFYLESNPDLVLQVCILVTTLTLIPQKKKIRNLET
jgi:hypothetical protein